MIKGIDISSLLEMETSGQKYYHRHVLITDMFHFLKDQGISSVRLRLWVDPYDMEGEPYLGGTCDLNRVLLMAKRLAKAGFTLLLDFHFSDFWTDPGKQTKPKAWKNFSFDELNVALETYTEKTIRAFKDHAIKLSYIQVGNEITNGFLWPEGKLYNQNERIVGGYERMSTLLKSAIKGIKKVDTEAKIILHLERSGDQKIYREWFTNVIRNGVVFDIIGLSYYPFYHGSFANLKQTIELCHHELHHPTLIVETGYVHTLCPAPGAEMVVKDYEDGYVPYPYSEKGQALFMGDLIKFIEEQQILGFYYWEPLWLPAKNISWSSVPGREYIHEEEKSDGNEWSNHALFDYEGESLLAWQEIKKG